MAFTCHAPEKSLTSSVCILISAHLLQKTLVWSYMPNMEYYLCALISDLTYKILFCLIFQCFKIAKDKQYFAIGYDTHKPVYSLIYNIYGI